MDEKMRAEFESWAVHQGYDLTRDDVVVAYASEETDRAWDAWQASRAALVIKLPKPYQRHRDSYINVMDAELVVEAIGDAGVRVKP